MSRPVTDPAAGSSFPPPAAPAGEDDVRPTPRAGGAGRDVLVVLGTFLALGVVCGVLWWLLVDPAAFTKVDGGGAMAEGQLEKRFAADGWYVVLAVVAGLPAGIVLTWWRARDYLLTTGLLVVGSLLAAATSAALGRVLGPSNPDAALATAPRGALVPVQLEVSAHVAYLAWPIAVLLGSLVVLWSKPLEPEL